VNMNKPSDISTISVNRHEKMGNCGNQHQQKVVVKGGFFLPYKPSTTLNKFSLNVSISTLYCWYSKSSNNTSV